MIPLIADPRVQEYDIIAIQELWQNLAVSTTLSLYQSGFYLLYKPGDNTCVCFYINNKIDLGSWEITYLSANMCFLALTVYSHNKPRIINIYNPSPVLYTSIDSPLTIPTAKAMVNAEGKHILLKDFNLYHLYWSGSSRPIQYAVTKQLLELLEGKNFSLTLPRDTIITWKARSSCSTIDLVFMTDGLVEHLEHCKSKEDIGQSSDHIPILTSLCLSSKTLSSIRQKAFKLLNMDKLQETKQIILSQLEPHNHNSIDTYTKSIQVYKILLRQPFHRLALPPSQNHFGIRNAITLKGQHKHYSASGHRVKSKQTGKHICILTTKSIKL